MQVGGWVVCRSFLSVISICDVGRNMLLRRAWGTTLRRFRSPRATTALASPFSSVKDDERHTVQVLHTRPPTSYVEVEQDIAALQRDIRTAYKYVACECIEMIVPQRGLTHRRLCTDTVTFYCRHVSNANDVCIRDGHFCVHLVALGRTKLRWTLDCNAETWSRRTLERTTLSTPAL